MTTFNWISLGISGALSAAYIILSIYTKRKTVQYDGLGGIIIRGRPQTAFPEADTEPIGNKQKNKTP